MGIFHTHGSLSTQLKLCQMINVTDKMYHHGMYDVVILLIGSQEKIGYGSANQQAVAVYL